MKIGDLCCLGGISVKFLVVASGRAKEGLIVRTLAPLPVRRLYVWFCWASLELIFLQHGSL